MPCRSPPPSAGEGWGEGVVRLRPPRPSNHVMAGCCGSAPPVAAGVSWLILSPTPCPLPPGERGKRVQTGNRVYRLPRYRAKEDALMPCRSAPPQRGGGLGRGGRPLAAPTSFKPRHGWLLRECASGGCRGLVAEPFPRLMTRVNRRPVVRRRNRPILMTCVNTGGARLMTCVNRRTVVRVLRVAAQRNLLRFTPIHAYFMGCLPGICSDLRYSRRILGFFCRNSARFSRDFGPQMHEIRVICRRARNFVTSVNRRTVVRAVLS